MQTEINHANEKFWNELCGSSLAQELGITGDSEGDLQRFDKAYFDFYPYLLSRVPVHMMNGKKVLEVGLGYGTLGQKIAQSGAQYNGLDIAAGPVNMMRHRLEMCHLTGNVVQGNMLSCPFEDSEMDFVVSIGCFHHTGNLQRCIDETYRILKPGGTAYIMVYNQRSYRQWRRWTRSTFKSVLRDWGLYKGNINVTEDLRGNFDCTLSGEAAPETILSSICNLKKMFSKFAEVSFKKENCDKVFIIPHLISISRENLLTTLGPLLGSDIYIEARK